MDERRFSTILTGQAVSAFGDAFANVAMPLLVLRITGSIAQMGFVAGMSVACQLVGGLFAGQVVDRVDRRRLLIGCDAAQLVLAGSIPTVWLVRSGVALPLIYCVVVISSLLFTVYQVGLRAWLPQLVGRSELVPANAKLTTVTQIAYGVGPALAGLAVSVAGEPAAIGFNAVTFGVAAAAWYLVRPAHPEPAQTSAPQRGVLGGIRFIWSDGTLRCIGILEPAASLLAAGAMTLFIYYVRHDLGAGSATVGLLLSLGSVGAVTAALVADRLRGLLGFGRAWLVSVLVRGIALTLAGLTHSAGTIAGLVVLFGFGHILSTVLATSLRQLRTPDRLLGRVSAAAITTVLGAETIGGVASTSTADLVSTRSVFVAIGVAGLLLAAAGSLTRLGRREPAGVRDEPGGDDGMHDDDDDTTTYVVVVNDEEQYSLWPQGRELPAGWRETGKSGTRSECIDYVNEVWTDMRPLSLRRQMDGESA